MKYFVYHFALLWCFDCLKKSLELWNILFLFVISTFVFCFFWKKSWAVKYESARVRTALLTCCAFAFAHFTTISKTVLFCKRTEQNRTEYEFSPVCQFVVNFNVTLGLMVYVYDVYYIILVECTAATYVLTRNISIAFKLSPPRCGAMQILRQQWNKKSIAMANPLQKPQVHVDLSTQRIICTHRPEFKYSIKVLQLKKHLHRKSEGKKYKRQISWDWDISPGSQYFTVSDSLSDISVK